MTKEAGAPEAFMWVRPEVVRCVDGRLFDAESYDRTETLNRTFAGESGYYVVLWTSEVPQPRDHAHASLVGPFPSAHLASAKADELT